jgi:hypothetical protein
MEWLKAIFEVATLDHARSTTLRPLHGALIITTIALLFEIGLGAPEWLLIITTICFSVVLLSFLTAYFYFMVKNPDCLRTERYSLQRMALEQNLGDSISGVINLPDTANIMKNVGVKSTDHV